MKKLMDYIDNNFDLSVAILMGLTTVCAAFFVFCASLWGSSSVASYSKSISQLNEANTTYLDYINEYVRDDIRELRMINGGLTVKEAEEETKQSEIDTKELLKNYEELKADSDQLLTEADEANNNGDKFQLVSVIMAIILFLSSMSLSAKEKKVKKLFFYFSTIMLLTTFIYSFALPFPFV